MGKNNKQQKRNKEREKIRKQNGQQIQGKFNKKGKEVKYSTQNRQSEKKVEI